MKGTNLKNTDKSQKPVKDKNGKLSTYIVVMLLSIIVVIIIAAMADDREQKFQSQIDSTTQANMTIQNEIVTLKDENYKLKQENDSMKKEHEILVAENDIFSKLNEVIKLITEDKPEEAAQKYSEIDSASIPEKCQALYTEVGQHILKPKD